MKSVIIFSVTDSSNAADLPEPLTLAVAGL